MTQPRGRFCTPPGDRHARTRALLAAALLALGCAGPTTTRLPHATASSTASPPIATLALAHGGASTAPSQPLASAAPVLTSSLTGSPTPSALVTAPAIATTLAGRILLPATLVANNGGNLVGNNGGGIIGNNGGGILSNNGGSFRLLALAQVPVAGALISLVDATGKPILGTDNKALTTTADAQGQYAFTVPLPAQHVVVLALPPGGTDAASRIVAPGVTTADVDLSSTLVSRYVVARYVTGQADPLKTLEKLPANVEAQTDQIAATAIADAVPTSLAPAVVVADVDALRAKNSALDAQLEVVRKLLIAAGVANLGSGLPATDVFLARIFQIAAAADSTRYMFMPDDFRIWRVSPNGQLDVAIGTGNNAASPPVAVAASGVPGPQLDLGYIWQMQTDAQGRLWILTLYQGLIRLESDGTVTTVLTQAALDAAHNTATSVFEGFVVQADGSVLLAADGKLLTIAPNTPAKTVATLPAGTAAVRGMGADSEGHAFLQTNTQFLRTDLASGQTTVWKALDPNGATDPNFNVLDLDATGNLFYADAADNQLHILRPDGTDGALLALSKLAHNAFRAMQGVDNHTYLSDCDPGITTNPAILQQIDAGVAKQVAGRSNYPTDFSSAGTFSLQTPFGFDLAPDNSLLVADNGSLLRIQPGGGATILHAAQTVVGIDPVQFTGVRALANGRMVLHATGAASEYLLDRDASGALTVRYTAHRTYANLLDSGIYAFDVAPDGTIYFSQTRSDSTGTQFVQVLALGPSAPTPLVPGLPSILVPESAGLNDVLKVHLDAQGVLHVLGSKQTSSKPIYMRGLPTATLVTQPVGTPFPDAVDATGRLYEGDAPGMTGGDFGSHQILRFAADGSAQTTLAGTGGVVFNGTGLDDAIGVATDLRFDTAGNLFFRDMPRRQVRRIPADRLP